MKRMFITFAGIAALGVAAYLGSQLRADPQSPATSSTTPAAAPKTRIAILNLSQVVTNYEKFKTFETQRKGYLEQIKADFDRKKAQGLQLKDQLAKLSAEDAHRDKVQSDLRTLERELQDMEEDAKKKVTKYENDWLVAIYRDIHEAVKSYARSNDLEMVLHYNDAIAEADLYHPYNVQRKMQTLACMPLYVADGMDISNIIIKNLNSRLARAPANGQQR